MKTHTHPAAPDIHLEGSGKENGRRAGGPRLKAGHRQIIRILCAAAVQNLKRLLNVYDEEDDRVFDRQHLIQKSYVKTGKHMTWRRWRPKVVRVISIGTGAAARWWSFLCFGRMGAQRPAAAHACGRAGRLPRHSPTPNIYRTLKYTIVVETIINYRHIQVRMSSRMNAAQILLLDTVFIVRLGMAVISGFHCNNFMYRVVIAVTQIPWFSSGVV